jgi:hypothetical protein
MGRKKINIPDKEAILLTMTKMFVPETILENFEIYDVQKRNENWIIELREKEEKIPMDLTTNVVLDGFCNPIEVMSFGFSLGPVYLKIYRRRWKSSNENKHYSNDYDLTLKGFKMVPELGIFLKEEDRRLSY